MSVRLRSIEPGLESTIQDSLVDSRLEFLDRELKILRSHWKGRRFETHPFAERIVPNLGLSKAIVEYWIKYTGGRAYLDRTDKGWELVRAGLRWIE